MARRRDRDTRAVQTLIKNMNASGDGKRVTPLVKNPYRGAEGRFTGRRGVRARARAQRIAMRQANGTYRQPNGGETTNS